MSQPPNWLIDIVRDASQRVDARPPARKSDYWEERRRQIEANRKLEEELTIASNDSQFRDQREAK